MVDEAHRSQEGDYGRKMRQALPNAFHFGLTGTPINRRDRNTFMWFGAADDEGGYLSRYSFQDSIRDGATLPLHFEPRLSEIHLDEAAIDRPRCVDRSRQDSVGLRDLADPLLRRPHQRDFDSLKQFARRETARVRVSGEGSGWRQLSARDLHDVESAAALPEVSESRLPMTVCRDGDLVGWPGNWRLLPPNFGETVTSMFVLHPTEGRGRLLCEWLNSRPEDSSAAVRMTGRKLMDIQVPVDPSDEEVERHLEAVQESRRRIQAAASNTLPNVFSAGQTDVHRLRDEIRSAASEAALVADLMRPVEDPVGRAEWTYPFHIASLARRYRISTHPAELQDGLLKLGEGIARVLGILALGELIADQGGFTAALRGQLRTGATFGTWTTFIGRFADGAVTPLLTDLGRLRDVGGIRDVLAAIKQVRNRTHHSHGVRAHHEIEKDVEMLEPHVISALTTANWLAANRWDWVERCEYLDDSSYRIVGLTLRGSHPSWEPFDRPSLSPCDRTGSMLTAPVETPSTCGHWLQSACARDASPRAVSAQPVSGRDPDPAKPRRARAGDQAPPPHTRIVPCAGVDCCRIGLKCRAAASNNATVASAHRRWEPSTTLV